MLVPLLAAVSDIDSDYTSDVNFPLHHNNASVHQFGGNPHHRYSEQCDNSEGEYDPDDQWVQRPQTDWHLGWNHRHNKDTHYHDGYHNGHADGGHNNRNGNLDHHDGDNNAGQFYEMNNGHPGGGHSGYFDERDSHFSGEHSINHGGHHGSHHSISRYAEEMNAQYDGHLNGYEVEVEKPTPSRRPMVSHTGAPVPKPRPRTNLYDSDRGSPYHERRSDTSEPMYYNSRPGGPLDELG